MDMERKKMSEELDRKHDAQMELLKGMIEKELQQFSNQFEAIKGLVNQQVNGVL